MVNPKIFKKKLRTFVFLANCAFLNGDRVSSDEVLKRAYHEENMGP